MTCHRLFPITHFQDNYFKFEVFADRPILYRHRPGRRARRGPRRGQPRIDDRSIHGFAVGASIRTINQFNQWGRWMREPFKDCEGSRGCESSWIEWRITQRDNRRHLIPHPGTRHPLPPPPLPPRRIPHLNSTSLARGGIVDWWLRVTVRRALLVGNNWEGKG